MTDADNAEREAARYREALEQITASYMAGALEALGGEDA